MGIEVYYDWDNKEFSALSTITMATFAREVKTPETIARKIAEWAIPLTSSPNSGDRERIYQVWLDLCKAIQEGKCADWYHNRAGKQVGYEEAVKDWETYSKVS
jgi:hypothetical protein